MKLYFQIALGYIKSLPARAKASVVNAIRNFLYVNDDTAAIANDINGLKAGVQSLNQEVFNLFNAAPFFAAVLTLDAASAAKMINTNFTQRNSLISLLTSICLAMRAGETTLQVQGTLPDSVRAELIRRKFKIEEVQGSGDNGVGLFILWT